MLPVINKPNLRQGFINGKVIYCCKIYIFLSLKASISAKKSLTVNRAVDFFDLFHSILAHAIALVIIGGRHLLISSAFGVYSDRNFA